MHHRSASGHIGKPSFLITLLLTLSGWYTTGSAQQFREMAAFATLEDFRDGEVMDSLRVRIEPVENRFTPHFCRPDPVSNRIDYPFLSRTVEVLYDGRDILLNLRKLKILNGFVWLKDARNYNCFMSRMAKEGPGGSGDAMLMFGLVGFAANELIKHANTSEEQAYVYHWRNAKVYRLTEETVERFLTPFPAALYAFRSDPTRHDLQTMVTYLDILEDLERASN